MRKNGGNDEMTETVAEEMTESSYIAMHGIILLIFIFMILAVFCVKVLVPFVRERSYIKTEINRTDGEELYYWKRELKKLYLRQIPFFGKMILKNMR